MTLIGKILTFLNLLVGLGVLTAAVSAYADRPAYFDPVPEGVDKGSSPLTFAGLKKDAEVLGRKADLASGLWGENLKALEGLEKRRDDRRAAFDQRLAWARKGNPKDKAAAGTGFYKAVFEKDAAGKETSFLDVAALGDPIVGPDGKPLRGADTLLADFSADVKKVAELAGQVEAARNRYKELSTRIVREEARLVAMTKIRDEVQAEAFYLAAAEVNVFETRETVFRRKRQLDRRLAELGEK